MEEKRKYLRFDTSLKISYKIVRTVIGEMGAVSSDISGGGIGVITNQHLQPGMFLDLKIFFTDVKEPVTALGEVVWVTTIETPRSGCKVGIKFVKIDSISRGKIINHIRQMMVEQGVKDVEWIDFQ